MLQEEDQRGVMEWWSAEKMRSVHEVDRYSQGLHKGKKRGRIGIKEIKNVVCGDT